MRKIWYNGKVLDESEAKLSIYDSALMFGDMVFEMTRSFNKQHFMLHEHLKRLQRSMRCLSINCEVSFTTLEKACHLITEANSYEMRDDDEHRLMINVSRGILSIYSGVVGVQQGPTVMITDFPLKWTVRGFGKLYDEGVNAVIPSQRAIPSRYLDPKLKHRSRLHLQVANIEVSKYTGDNNWALLLDEDGFIAEGTGDNFFIVKDGVVYTPEGRDILRGVSREYVIALCGMLSIECIEKNIEPYDVLDADEAFMTGTPFCILPVTQLNHKCIGSSSIGYYTKLLLDEWGNSVGVDIIKQIKLWNTTSTDSLNVTPYMFKEMS